MRLAIVGSQAKAWDLDTAACVRGVIRGVCAVLEPAEIISGRSPGGGVDQWAEDYASLFGIQFTPFEASQNDWPHFKARNIQIAEYCTHLLAIRSLSSKTYGSGWTADFAEKLGKKVWRVTL